MIISFDIDNTLIPYQNEFELEELNVYGKLFKAERLRKGTKMLFKMLEAQKHEIWIYTTSYRTKLSLAKTFYSHGLYPKRYINGELNTKYLTQYGCTSSKNPKLFGIDIHVDDSEGVRKEGERYGFETIIVNPSNENWAFDILEHIEAIQMNLAWQYEQLLITLVSLKSDAVTQKKIYGLGCIGDEMVIDYDSYYTKIREYLLKYGYINNVEDDELKKLDDFISMKSDENETSFWFELDSHPDWNKIRALAKGVLILMNKDDLEVDVIHKNEVDIRKNLVVQYTQTKLKKKEL